MKYTVDILYLARRFSAILNAARRENRTIDEILPERVTVEDLIETALRIYWNTFNERAEFPWVVWDDDSAIRIWFKGYTLDPIGFDRNNDEIIDEPSHELYREVIDPFCVFLREFIRELKVRSNPRWEEHIVSEVRYGLLIVENCGDFRIRDWERIQREKRESKNDGYQF